MNDAVSFSLLQPPVGDDLEYDPAFLELERLAAGRPERQFGDTIIPAEAPDWSEVERAASALCTRTADLRVVAHLTRAWTETRGIDGYAEGVSLAADMLEAAWDHVHPRLDADGPADPLPRMNALAALTDAAGVGRALRAARLIEDGRDGLTLREVEALLEGRGEADYPGGRDRLLAALRAAAAAEAPVLRAASGAAGALRRIAAVVTHHLGAEWAPAPGALARTLDAVTTAAEPPPVPAAPEPAEAAADGPAPRAAASGEIATRAEAVAMLASVARYFETHEPSHPAPLLIARVQQLIPLGFHDILRNLAPQGLSEFEAWLPRRPESGT